MPSSLPVAADSRKAILVVSLIGHYERIAQYLLRDDGLRKLPWVAGTAPLRVRARSLVSMVKACGVIAYHLLVHDEPLIGIPRSNSRAIRLLTWVFSRAKFFSYSDGLGDSVHRFYFESKANYVGHIGFSSLAVRPLIHEIPLVECVEPWGRWIVHDPDGPVLVIVKVPKETRFDVQRLGRLYARTVAALGRSRTVLVSGGLVGLSVPGVVSTQNVGALMNLSAPLAISGVVGLPSTAFLTLVTRLPMPCLRIMRLHCRNSFPDANQRITLMRCTLNACMRLLVPPGGSTTRDRAEMRADP